MALCPWEKGPLARGHGLPAPLASQEPPSIFFSPSFGRSLLLYILFLCHPPPTLVSHPPPTLVSHPPPTLISHPCPYLSARPIGHSFWHSMSCCGPHRTVQESRPHK